jgi:hypothetical protein
MSAFGTNSSISMVRVYRLPLGAYGSDALNIQSSPTSGLGRCIRADDFFEHKFLAWLSSALWPNLPL